MQVINEPETSKNNVIQNEKNDLDSQKWIIKETEEGSYNIISKENGLYLTVASEKAENKVNIEVDKENNLKTQKFKLEEVEDNKEKQIIKDGIYSIKTILNNKYGLDVSCASKKDGANIQLYEFVDVNQQKFQVKYENDGYYTITSFHSGKVLDVAGARKESGTNVQQYESNNTSAQKWLIKDAGNGSYNIISKCNGLYLDVNAGKAANKSNIQVYEGNGTDAQKFKFESMDKEEIEEKQLVSDGTYVIKTKINEKYGLDVSCVSKKDGANIQLYEYVKENQQKFQFKYDGNGYYTITALHSGKVLDVVGAGKDDGTNVQQYESNNTNAQKWLIKDAGNGSYNIISKCNGLYLDVNAGKATNKSNIQVYTGNGTNAQKFMLVKCDIYEEKTYGKSGLAVKGDLRGTNLKYYKFGRGENVLFTTFSIHGFEDSFDHDGAELTYIAEQFKTYLSEKTELDIYENWTIYILPTLNPDGQTYGTTNNGAGRTTLYSSAPNHQGIDMNRNFQTSDYATYKDDRNYNGTEAFQAYEARYLRDFLLNNKSQKGQTILIDLHGWLEETMGDNELGAFYRNELELTKHISTYGRGYLINWARMSLGNSNKTARTALIELPQVNSHEELVKEKYADKYIDATINMLKSIK